MEIVGKIIQVLPLQQGVSARTGNPWQIQSYVLETIESYPRKVCFEVFGENQIRANQCNIDDVVTVSFDLDSREFNGRWYTSVRAWKIQQGVVTGATNTTAQPVQQPVAQPVAQPVQQPTSNINQFTPQTPSVDTQDDGTDLPF